MKYFALISDTNEWYEADSLKTIFLAVRRTARNSHDEGRKFMAVLFKGESYRDRKIIGGMVVKQNLDTDEVIFSKTIVDTYLLSSDAYPYRHFVETWTYIEAFDLEEEI